MTAGGSGPRGSPQPVAETGTEAALVAGDVALLNEIALRFFRRRLPGSWAPRYLTGRGFGPAVQRRWEAGYAPAGRDQLTQRLRSLGVPDEAIEGAGLARRNRQGILADVFRDRAVLPIRSLDGRVAGFIGRASANARPGTPKYLNSPQTCLYDKSTMLFGPWEARSALAQGARPVLAEGPFDAIAVTIACAGQFAGLAPCGAALTAGQIAALAEVADLAETGVLVAFDPDQAGRRAAVRAYHLLSPFTSNTEVANLPTGEDPAQILTRRGTAALAEALSHSRPLADLVVGAEIDRWSRWLDHAEGRINALHAAAPLVAAMPVDHVARQVARLADRLGMDHAAVTAAVTDAIPAVLDRLQRSADVAAAARDHVDRAAGQLSPTPETGNAPPRRNNQARLSARRGLG